MTSLTKPGPGARSVFPPFKQIPLQNLSWQEDSEEEEEEATEQQPEVTGEGEGSEEEGARPTEKPQAVPAAVQSSEQPDSIWNKAFELAAA